MSRFRAPKPPSPDSFRRALGNCKPPYLIRWYLEIGALCRFFAHLKEKQENGKILPRAAGGFLRGRLWRAAARHSAPLKPTSLVTFLFGDKKVTPPSHAEYCETGQCLQIVKI